MIDVRLSDSTISRGNSISGSATWTGTKPPDRVTARVGWVTEGRGDENSEYFDEAEMEISGSEFGSVESFSFTLRVPIDGPPSYDGKILRILWVVEVRLDLPWAKDEKAAAPFRVVL